VRGGDETVVDEVMNNPIIGQANRISGVHIDHWLADDVAGYPQGLEFVKRLTLSLTVDQEFSLPGERIDLDDLGVWVAD